MDSTKRTKPRKIPKQRRSQELVDALLEAATRVLAQEGIAGATTAHIAEIAGISEGSLYQYFPTKAALLAAVLERQARAELALLEGLAGEVAALPLAEAVRRLTTAFVAAHLARPRLHRELLAAMDELERRGFVDVLLASAVERVTSWLKARSAELGLEARSAELGLEDAEVTAFVLVHALHASVHAAAEHRAELLAQRRLQPALERLVLRYLRA